MKYTNEVQQTKFNIMDKRISHAFGKDVYLLGKDKDNEIVWLESPKWDCGWYWGFGYIETYTNRNNPSMAKDISSHTHWDTIHENAFNAFSEKTFSENEYKELKELFVKFYKLRKKADNLHSKLEYKNKYSKKRYNDINKIEIPFITMKIINILKPEK